MCSAASASDSSGNAFRSSRDMWSAITDTGRDPKGIRATWRRLRACSRRRSASARRCGRARGLELVPDLAHEDVDGAIAVRESAAPHLLEELVPGDDLPPARTRGRRGGGTRWASVPRLAPHVRLHVQRVDLQLLDLDWLAAALVLDADAAAPPRARARQAPSWRTASRGSRPRRSRARAPGRARRRAR